MQVVKFDGNARVRVIEVADPSPADGELLVALRSSLLCGSELHAYHGERELPTNPGHEGAGVVVEARGNHRWRAGDRVGIHAVWGCGACDWCARGIYTYCDRRRGCPGLHAELVAAPAHVLLPLPDDVDFDTGALLSGDGLGVPFHTSQRLPTRGGETVAVLGCGPIGLGTVLLHAFRGARVIAFDRVPERLSLAARLGAAEGHNVSSVDPVAAVTEATSGRMAEAVVEATGRAEGFATALRLVAKGGTVACCGENREVTLHVGEHLIRRDVTIFGSWFFHFREYPEMVELYRRGLAVDQLVTHTWPLAEAATAYREFTAGRVGKPALHPAAR